MPSRPTFTTKGTNIVTFSRTCGAVAPVRTISQAEAVVGEAETTAAAVPAPTSRRSTTAMA
ncbi:hypothetical protein [Streptomyces sp. NPDC048606]|uniref:hypothetical protein n=1 Tax=Streptomyces sp. NPDC048606 TaxID=3154726 RepID=UPI003433B4FB